MMKYNCLLFSMLIITFTSCSTLRPLEYRSLNNFNISSLSSTPQLTFDLSLYNPNVVGAKLKNFTVDFEMNGVRLTNAQLADVSHAGAQSEFIIPMNISTSIEQLSQFLPSGIKMFTSGATIPIHLNGSVTVKKFIFHKTFPFDVRESLDTKRIRLGN